MNDATLDDDARDAIALTYYDYCGPIQQALYRAVWRESIRHPGDQATVILLIKAVRELRAQLPYASDGLWRRTARMLAEGTTAT